MGTEVVSNKNKEKEGKKLGKEVESKKETEEKDGAKVIATPSAAFFEGIGPTESSKKDEVTKSKSEDETKKKGEAKKKKDKEASKNSKKELGLSLSQKEEIKNKTEEKDDAKVIATPSATFFQGIGPTE